MRRIFFALVFCNALGFQPVTAAIITAPGVAVTENFAAAPTATNWSTASMGGNSNGAITNAAGLTAAVNSGLDTATDPDALPATSAVISNALSTSSGFTTGGSARWNSATGVLFSQPTNNYYTALLATVTNSTGLTLDSMTLSYDQIVVENGAGTESVPGFLVYFSATGGAGSWSLISPLSGVDPNTAGTPPVTTTTALSTTFSGLTWAPGTSVYVLFADDNTGSPADDTLAIDNVSWTATAVPEPSSVALLSIAGLFSAGLGIRKFRQRN